MDQDDGLRQDMDETDMGIHHEGLIQNLRLVIHPPRSITPLITPDPPMKPFSYSPALNHSSSSW